MSTLRWQPDGSVEFDLERPLVGNSGHPQAAARLRPPGVREVFQFGEPEEMVYAQAGKLTQAVNTRNLEAVRGYAAACLVSHSFDEIEAKGTLRDARRLQEAVVGFFREREPAPATSPASPTASSSATAGPPTS